MSAVIVLPVAKQDGFCSSFFQRLDAALLNASLVTTETVISVKINLFSPYSCAAGTVSGT